ncbi:MAG: DHH family phosphoesterase [Oscillospiraceae bacterium]|nr:DHH family phosphoesterase [Oscillospiraceae bacterium]
MFKLSEILKYDNIVIQCHDNPDADAISSAYGIYAYLAKNGKESKIIYSGIEKIKKSNVLLMLELLEIPIEHVRNVDEFPKPGLLICVDCQYGEGNVAKIEADAVAIIDHHLQVVGDDEYDMGIIQSQLGSCATVVWLLLRNEDFDFAKEKTVSMSLYYGLLTDTNNFSEISHPLDKDMRDTLHGYCDRAIIRRLSLCNLTLEELEIAGVALLRNVSNINRGYALFKAEYCDPNILGFISDLALQVDTVNICIVYNIRESGAKISVRSCSREVMASEYVEYITRGVGSGGGHRDKAGGFLQKAEIDDLGMTMVEYMNSKTEEYFDSFDSINASKHDVSTDGMKKYKKKAIPIGFTPSTDLFEEGAPIMVRTLEGDSNITAASDIYLMVGIKGEVYPTKKEKFELNYNVCDFSMMEYPYEPTAKNELTGEIKKLSSFLKFCVSSGSAPIFAKPLERNTKVFTEWNPNGYMYGKPGDYLAIKYDDINDMYIIQEEIFYLTYEEIN